MTKECGVRNAAEEKEKEKENVLFDAAVVILWYKIAIESNRIVDLTKRPERFTPIFQVAFASCHGHGAHVPIP